MKNLRRSSARILGAAVALLLVLSACGSESEDKSSGGSAEMPDLVKVGVLMPFTGPAAFIGEEIRTAVDIWAEHYNATAADEGLPKVEPIYEDTEASASVGVRAYQKAQANGDVPVVISAYTNVLSGFAPYATRDKVTVLQGGQGSNVTDLGPTVMQQNIPYDKQLRPVFEAATAKGIKTVATIAIQDNEAFLEEASRVKNDLCPKFGCEVVAEATMSADASDAAAAATRVLAAKPDAVFFSGVQSQFVPVATKLKDDQFEGVYIGSVDMDEMIVQGHANLIEGAVFAQFHTDVDSEAFKQFEKDWRASKGSDVPGYAVLGYKSGQIIESVIRSLNEDGKGWEGPEILEGLLAFDKLDTISGEVFFDDRRRITEKLNIVTVEKGERKLIETVLAE